jgi:hypothetical protein
VWFERQGVSAGAESAGAESCGGVVAVPGHRLTAGVRPPAVPIFSRTDWPRLVRGFFGVPSMIDSLEVKVLHPA